MTNSVNISCATKMPASTDAASPRLTDRSWRRPAGPGGEADNYPSQVLSWLSTVIYVCAVALALVSAFYLLRNRLLDDWLLLVAAVLELGLLVQLVVGVVQGATTSRDYEKAVFFAYLVTVPFVPPFATLLALKERTRWAMGILLGSALVVVVLVARLNQIWSAHA